MLFLKWSKITKQKIFNQKIINNRDSHSQTDTKEKVAAAREYVQPTKKNDFLIMMLTLVEILMNAIPNFIDKVAKLLV